MKYGRKETDSYSLTGINLKRIFDTGTGLKKTNISTVRVEFFYKKTPKKRKFFTLHSCFSRVELQEV